MPRIMSAESGLQTGESMNVGSVPIPGTAPRSEVGAAAALAVGVAALGAAWSIADHFAFGTGAFDAGIIDHALWRITHGYDDASTLNGQHLFVDHPSPILLLLLPVYAVKPAWGLPTYFALRAASAGMVVWAAFLLSDRFGLDRATRRTVVLATALGPGLALIIISEPSTIALAIGPLALAMAIGLTGGSRVWFAVLVGLAAASRAEIAVGVLALGGLLLRRSRAHARVALWIGGAFAVSGVIWLFVVGDAAGFSGHLGHLGDSFAEAVGSAVRRPWDALAPLFDLEPWRSLAVWLAGFGLIAPLLGRRWLLPAAPLLAIPFLGTWEFADHHRFQYWQLLLAVGAVASIMALVQGRLRADHFRYSVGLLLPVVWVLAIVPLGESPIPTRSPTDEAAADIVAIVDERGYDSVTAPPRLVPHLTNRRAVHRFPFPFACPSAIPGYRYPDVLPEAVVLLDEHLDEWEPRLGAFGYRLIAEEEPWQIWVTEEPLPAPTPDCGGFASGV